MALTKFLTTNTAKLSKGEGRGVDSAVLYLAPADSSGIRNVCPWASKGCKATCLGETSGRMVMDSCRKARAWRTDLLYRMPVVFWQMVRTDIEAIIRRAEKNGDKAAVRLDGTSDLGLAQRISADYPGVMFYDYTKSYARMSDWLFDRTLGNLRARNRHLTFSRSEGNEWECLSVLKNGGNVAVVFSTKRGDKLPKTWNGYRVIDGDTHDHRFNDPKGVVVGLRAKGAARKDTSGFVVAV